jgi:hypothetical protein
VLYPPQNDLPDKKRVIFEKSEMLQHETNPGAIGGHNSRNFVTALGTFLA